MQILFYLDRLEIKNPDASEDKVNLECSFGGGIVMALPSKERYRSYTVILRKCT